MTKKIILAFLVLYLSACSSPSPNAPMSGELDDIINEELVAAEGGSPSTGSEDFFVDEEPSETQSAEPADDFFAEEDVQSFEDEAFMEPGQDLAEDEFAELSQEDLMEELPEEFGEEFAQPQAKTENTDPFAEEDPFAGEDPFASEDPFAEENPFQDEINEEDLFAQELNEPAPAQPVEPAPSFEEPQDSFQTMESSPAEMIQITDLNFLGNQNGGTVEVKTSQPANYTTRTNADTNQFIIEIENAKLPRNLQRPLITKDFNSQVAAVQAYQDTGSTVARIVVQMKSKKIPLVQAEGNSLLVMSPEPLSEPTMMADSEMGASGASTAEVDTDSLSYDTEAAKRDEQVLQAQSLEEFLMGNNKFYGRKISLETGKDADVRDVINFIAEQSGANIVISEDVGGTIQMKLREVPWDQALVILLRSKKLGYVRQGNVLRISTLDQLSAETKASKEIIESRQKLNPLMVKVIPISYSEVEDLAKQVKEFLTPNRGSVIADKRTTSLIIRDTAETLTKITRLVKELDIPPAQVMIEGKLVEASESFQETFGIDWGFTGRGEKVGTGPNGQDINLQTGMNIVNLGEKTSVGNFTIRAGVLNFLGNLNARLALEETNNNIKVISSPRIMAMNKEEAEINQSGEVFTRKTITDNTGTPQTENIPRPYNVSMKVTPQVTAEGSVIMDVEVQREFPGPADTNTGERPINKREAKTKTLVKNGQTAVIGGIFQNDTTSSESGVPVLKDIPFLGWLFKSESVNIEKTELLVFLTPRIMNLQDQDVDTSLLQKAQAVQGIEFDDVEQKKEGQRAQEILK